MDPNATLAMILELLKARDLDGAADSWLALRDWLARGGFEPNWLEEIRRAINGR